MNDIAKVLGYVFLAAVLILLAPIGLIWSWNQLFGAAHPIPLSFETWLASAAFLSLIGGSRGKR